MDKTNKIEQNGKNVEGKSLAKVLLIIDSILVTLGLPVIAGITFFAFFSYRPKETDLSVLFLGASPVISLVLGWTFYLFKKYFIAIFMVILPLFLYVMLMSFR